MPLSGQTLSPTYSAAFIGVTPAASCTDLATINGDGTKQIRVKRVKVSGIATANDSTPVALVKRSALDTGGTGAGVTAVPHESSQAVSVATVTKYTANPTLGTAVGSVRTDRLVLAKATASGGLGSGSVEFDLTKDGKEIVLNTATEQLAVNLNGGTVPSGAALDVSFTWTEEALP